MLATRPIKFILTFSFLRLALEIINVTKDLDDVPLVGPTKHKYFNVKRKIVV